MNINGKVIIVKKTVKIILLVVVIIVISIVVMFISKRLQASLYEENGASSIAIIGGADGPTSVFLAGKIGGESGDENMGSSQTNTGSAQTNISYTQINMDIAKSIFEVPGDYIILDVRRADEFVQGHIPGAINIANEDIGDEDIAQLPDKEQTIYVYCRSGNRSKQAAEKLVNLGYENIIEFGGIIDWKGTVEK